MAKEPLQRKPKTNDLARDVDRLLRQLSVGDSAPSGGGAVPPRSPYSKAAAATLAPGHSTMATRRASAEPSALAQRISAWLRALLAVALGAAVTVWPYASDCGWMLDLALLVIATVVVAGVWAGIWTWRLRAPVAHVLSLGVVLWGLVLAAEQVLPRVGYAAVTAAWSCAIR